MAHPRSRTTKDRAFLLALKEALRAPHAGADAVPRKSVWLELGIAESTYSRWLDPEHLDWMPSLADLRRWINLTGDAGPLLVLGDWTEHALFPDPAPLQEAETSPGPVRDLVHPGPGADATEILPAEGAQVAPKAPGRRPAEDATGGNA